MTDQQSRAQLRLGIDTGGTFTDFIAFDGSRIQVIKLPSTPAAPDRAVVEGVDSLKAGFDNDQAGRVHAVHGSTVATNALLERKLARTAYVTNEGLTDVLSIGRQARPELYNLQPLPQAPPVPRDLCIGIAQRTAGDGSQLQALTDETLDELINTLRQLAPESVAINLLFSFLDVKPEQQIEQALREALEAETFICRSSDVLPEHREYERGIVTWLNAALGPRMSRYLGRLRQALPELAIMHSAAGTIAVEQAAGRAVNLLLSGPAGGLLGARFMGSLAGEQRLLTLDMGGTSTDVALVDGEIGLTDEGSVGGYPVGVPMVDMHTIGAGGGSIARLDAGGMLQVGPESAGAEPGPACYGKGGHEPTVTDANVVLGRLPTTVSLGGNLALDADKAVAAVSSLAEAMGIDRYQAAEGIVRVANEAMAKALRVISVSRGEDPRTACLLSFGGAGGLHVCALADALDMRKALVPLYAGVLSALGMLVAPRTRQLSRSLLRPVGGMGQTEFGTALEELRAHGLEALEKEGVAAADIRERVSADLRYAGQSFSLNLDWQGPEHTAEAFHRAHEQRYGHRMDMPVELVNLRLALQGPAPELPLQSLPEGEPAEPVGSAGVYGLNTPVPVYARDRLLRGQRIAGPAIVSEAVATTWIAPGWHGQADRYGNLILSRPTIS